MAIVLPTQAKPAKHLGFFRMVVANRIQDVYSQLSQELTDSRGFIWIFVLVTINITLSGKHPSHFCCLWLFSVLFFCFDLFFCSPSRSSCALSCSACAVFHSQRPSAHQLRAQYSLLGMTQFFPHFADPLVPSFSHGRAGITCLWDKFYTTEISSQVVSNSMVGEVYLNHNCLHFFFCITRFAAPEHESISRPVINLATHSAKLKSGDGKKC